jgi:phage terminase small subunit
MKALTAKQELFVAEYIVDFNGADAVRRAGYNALLAKPEIQEAIAKGMEQRVKRVKVDADWVLTSAKQVFDRCMQVEQVFDRKGEPVLVETPTGELVPAFTFDSAGANRALELVGKHVDVQAFRERHEHTGKDGGPIETVSRVELVGVRPEGK